METIRIPLTRECAARVAKALAETAAACPKNEAAMAATLFAASEGLHTANEGKDRDGGFISIPYKYFALVMAELDWAYCNTNGGGV